MLTSSQECPYLQAGCELERRSDKKRRLEGPLTIISMVVGFQKFHKYAHLQTWIGTPIGHYFSEISILRRKSLSP